MMEGHKKIIGLCGLMLILQCCDSRTSSSDITQGTQKASSETNAQLQNEDGKVHDQRSARIFDEGSPESEFWKQFLAEGQYRVARSSDFNIPAWAMQKPGNDIGKAIDLACIPGDFNQDNASDRACIIVERHSDPARFGLVIINGLEGKDSSPKLYWLYRAQDLSSTVMGWSRDGLNITEFHQDGTYSVCHVHWDQERQDYACLAR